MYSLNQAPRAWYERSSKFLINNDFKRGTMDTILLLKHYDNNISVVQIYVDDIIFRSITRIIMESSLSYIGRFRNLTYG